MPYKDPTSAAAKASNARKSKRWRENHPGSWKRLNARNHRQWWYRSQYGTSDAEFEAQIARQNGLCPIGNHPFGPRGKGKTSPCQDHDHESGKNRLILCREHNVGLGMFHDSIEKLESALQYLKNNTPGFRRVRGEVSAV
jgi:hypothetical protein